MAVEELPQRRSIRLKNYDYTQSGYYFITICTHNRQRLFGEIHDGEMHLNDFGCIVDFTWNDLENHNDIRLHEYVIMPDHIHGIIEICDRRERSVTVPLPSTSHYRFGIPEIIRQFKTFAAKRINEECRRNGLEPFPTGRLWQKSYYEHVIRDENDYLTKAEYIQNNPLKREVDL